jgi:spermidine synthase
VALYHALLRNATPYSDVVHPLCSSILFYFILFYFSFFFFFFFSRRLISYVQSHATRQYFHTAWLVFVLLTHVLCLYVQYLVCSCCTTLCLFHITTEQSKFQHIQIIETAEFGKTLVLDSKTQSALRDEFIYHESLVHPVMLNHPCPKRVYIGGGGELGTAREILKHKSVEKVVMVDIDEQVVNFCKRDLPEWHDGCIDDERLELHYTDARGFLAKSEEKFDVIIMDIADPIEAGPGILCYTQDFLKIAQEKLNPNGCIVTQSGACSLLTWHECFTVVNKTLGSVFEHVAGYSVDIPSFGCTWGFNLAYNSHDSISTTQMADRSPAEIDTLIAERIVKPLRAYDGIFHRRIFSLPRYVRDGLAEETRIMTDEAPVFMY